MAVLGASSRPGRQTRTRLFQAAVVLGVLAVPFVVQAEAITDISQNVVSFVTLHVIYPVVQLLGNLLVALINIMVAVAAYNDFIHATAVEKGFIIVRDLANMFFIVVLLIIAFGTVLNIQQYRYNRLLGRLILMAFLVNYARFIAGIFIDAAQVVMLTFVNAFRQAAAGNLTTAFGIEQLLALRTSKDIGGYELVGAMLLALALVLIACIVVGVYVVVLLTRIIALWLLIILSPFAYVLRTFPAGQKYASEWWSNFSKYVVCGPVMAFFLWLSLTVVAVSNADPARPLLKVDLNRGEIRSQTGVGSGLLGDIGSEAATDISATISEISESNNLLKYMVAILLMIGSLMVAQQLCGAAGRFAGEWSGKAINAAKFATGVTAAATALGYGRKKVEQGWELTKGGGRALAGALPGRAVRWIDYNAPFLNPAALLRGWRAARDEKSSRAREHATDVATRYAQQVQTSVLGEIPLTKSWWKRIVDPRKWRGQLVLPHEQKSDLKALGQIEGDLGPMEKRELAQQSWDLRDMGGADGDFYRVAAESKASKEGYMDDLMEHPDQRAAMKEAMPKLFGSRQVEDDITHEMLTVEDEYYGPAQLNAYLRTKHKDSRKRIIQAQMDRMGEVGRKIGHLEYEGQNTWDKESEDYDFVKVVNPDGTINPDGEDRQVEESTGELIKQAPQDIAGLQVDSYISRRKQKVLHWEGPKQGQVKIGPDGKPEERVTGGSMQKMHKKIFSKMTGLGATDMVRRIKPRLFEWMIGTADQIDEDGYLNVDELTFSNIVHALENNPRFMRIAWQQIAPAKHQKKIKIRAWDGKGNIAKIGAGKWKGKDKQLEFDISSREKAADFASDTGPQTPRGLDYYFGRAGSSGPGGGTPGGGTPGGGTPGGGGGGTSGGGPSSGGPGGPGGGAGGGGTPGGGPSGPGGSGGGTSGGAPGSTTPPGGGGGRGGRGGGGTSGGVGTATVAAVAGAAAMAAASARGKTPARPPVGDIVEAEFEEIEPGAQTTTGRATEVRDSLSGEITRLEQERQRAVTAGRATEAATLAREIEERRKVVAAAAAVAATTVAPEQPAAGATAGAVVKATPKAPDPLKRTLDTLLQEEEEQRVKSEADPHGVSSTNFALIINALRSIYPDEGQLMERLRAIFARIRQEQQTLLQNPDPLWKGQSAESLKLLSFGRACDNGLSDLPEVRSAYETLRDQDSERQTQRVLANGAGFGFRNRMPAAGALNHLIQGFAEKGLPLDVLARPAPPPSPDLRKQIRAAQAEVDAIDKEVERTHNAYLTAVRAGDPRATELLEARQKTRAERESAMGRLDELLDRQEYMGTTQPAVQPQPKVAPPKPAPAAVAAVSTSPPSPAAARAQPAQPTAAPTPPPQPAAAPAQPATKPVKPAEPTAQPTPPKSKTVPAAPPPAQPQPQAPAKGPAASAAGAPRQPGAEKSMEEHLAELNTAIAGGLDELKKRVEESNKSLSALSDSMKQFAEKGSLAGVQGLQDQMGQIRRFLEQLRSGSPVSDDSYQEFVRKFREFLEEFRRYSDKLQKGPLPSVGVKTKDQADQEEGSAGSTPRRPKPPQPPRPPEPTSVIPPAQAA